MEVKTELGIDLKGEKSKQQKFAFAAMSLDMHLQNIDALRQSAVHYKYMIPNNEP
jgi:hypothetical protein